MGFNKVQIFKNLKGKYSLKILDICTKERKINRLI